MGRMTFSVGRNFDRAVAMASMTVARPTRPVHCHRRRRRARCRAGDCKRSPPLRQLQTGLAVALATAFSPRGCRCASRPQVRCAVPPRSCDAAGACVALWCHQRV
eukprot:CAMPEP_0119166454 /NCGR_PEP_ID=MMETSP1315-20130426/5874_1 /TAXON_ID=676789 /ORGANISM="Prasinoderma singularis, Strain RCC927" /LENGTH=104 /DNA_ID=CAMNT_0007159837 /DNA_START=610 /DNA_END=924 /DNA_ORIENTATION=+